MIRAFLDAKTFIRTVAPLYLDELSAAGVIFNQYADSIRAKGHTGEGSTSIEDCLMLYLLVRHFKRRHVLDVGTNIGATAMALDLAAKKNGGSCVTCDPIDYGCLPENGPRFIKAASADALAQLKSEGRTIDFAFFDWIPDKRTLDLAFDVFEPDAILAAHDYGINTKGQEIIDAIARDYRRAWRGQWVVPGSPDPIAIDNSMAINMCTAYFLPDEITSPQPAERIYRRAARLGPAPRLTRKALDKFRHECAKAKFILAKLRIKG